MNDLHIMLVDDEPSILDLTSRFLEQMGCRKITPCQSGQSALDKYRESKNSFDVIICDLNMPEMNGVELIRHLSEENFHGGIILLSGEDERILETAKDLAKARNLNVLGYISKPFNREALEILLLEYTPQDLKISAPLLDDISEKELRASASTPVTSPVARLALA